LVWSDPEIIKLSTQFVTVADEVYMLYPEDQWNLDRVKNDPAHLFFKKFGESVPKENWHHPGTKQGVYMMGPNGEYLEAKFAAAVNSADILARMKRALNRWETLKSERGYQGLPIPPAKPTHPPEITGQLIFRVNSRDLPRGNGDQSGRRITAEEQRNNNVWSDFTKWAWNESWVGLPSVQSFVPKSNQAEEVNQRDLRSIARIALLDNVRGQNPEWREQDIKSISFTMRRITTKNGLQTIQYTGLANISDGRKSYLPTCYGEGIFNPETQRFNSLDLVWIGPRSGSAQFNQRDKDQGPAPMGITLSLFN
jgi:hypothetical protein